MNILFYRYGSICEPDIIETFEKLQIKVIEETTEVDNKQLTGAERVRLVSEAIERHHPLFVFSINFFPAIAEVCGLYQTKYVCWTVDSPVPELFSKAMQRETNRIFLFDKAQYDRFHPYNSGNIIHLPLASATERFDRVVERISKADRDRYCCDISFVGSLYKEKNPLRRIGGLSEYAEGFIRGLTEASLKVMGYNFIEDAVSDEVVQELRKKAPDFYFVQDSIAHSDRYVAAHEYIGMQAAEAERVRTLNTLAGYFDVDLFTRSDTSDLCNVRIHGGIKTLTEMPKVFHLSKINLNMTIKPIQTGLPLRIFDIMGCGGFLMTNYQQELTDHFEIGVDLESYGSMEELVDKCDYYLSHEEERQKIARNGYEKVKQYHTYVNRIAQMIRKVAENENSLI